MTEDGHLDDENGAGLVGAGSDQENDWPQPQER